jgi:osmotically inducible protein OsmC
MAIRPKIFYTAEATATGGRDGEGHSSDGKLSVKLARPIEMGGTGEGTNPEQLFAVGYAACFMGALGVVAEKAGVTLPADMQIDSKVGIGATPPNGFGIQVAMAISLPGIPRDQAEHLVEEAHKVCPYSNATRNNIPVELSVV